MIWRVAANRLYCSRCAPAWARGRRPRMRKRMDLGLGLFYYTLIVLLAVILTAATCLASYLVTRNKTYRYAFAGFLFYLSLIHI